MAGCVLRIEGTNLDCPRTLQLTSKSDYGFVVNVSNADGNQFQKQIDHAITFLRRHSAVLQALTSATGFKSATMDFSVWNKAPKVVAQSLSFPPKLIALANKLGFTLSVTIYLASDN